jgi:condensin-2 complex subunit H2
MVKTYEQLCQEHVANYLKSAERYATETQLARRVGEWQQRLTPLLEAEERHRAFDIFSYGEEVIDTLAKRDEAKAGQEIELDQLLRGKERFEVCRLFLATLQLANNGNVDIVHKPREVSAGSVVVVLCSVSSNSQPIFLCLCVCDVSAGRQ